MYINTAERKGREEEKIATVKRLHSMEFLSSRLRKALG